MDAGERSTGYWARLLRERGVAVTAYDLHPTGGHEHNGHHAMDLHGDATKTNPPPFTTGATAGCEEGVEPSFAPWADPLSAVLLSRHPHPNVARGETLGRC